MPNITYYHLHSDLSLLDCATKFTMYLDKAVEYGMKAIGFSEHGNIFQWIKKKQEIEKRGMKYIHGLEAYVTESLDEKIRDNYHMIFIARNWEGVKELNKMVSNAYNKDGHFYYDARFTLDEVINTSDNIIITTSCLGGLLWKGRNNEKLINKFMEFAIKNKHRVFLEIQYHNHPDQIQHNQNLYKLHKQYGFKLICGTDTHALDEKYAKARKIIMQAKGIQFTDEDKFDLTFKPYDEVVKMFEIQNSLPKNVYLEAIENTNYLANMIEEFELDKSHKYPKLYDNPEQVFKEKINDGVLKRGINKFDKEKRKLYYDRIKEEFDVYKKLNTIDYMLLQKDIIDWCHENGIYQGYGRGSVNGSIIAYLLGITEMDSIKHKLNFFRFMNPERISLADIDVDFPPSKRQDVIDYIANKPNIYFSEIVTFNTIALKGAIREVGRALNYDLKTIDEIAKNIETNEKYYREKYPDLFEYVDLVNGVNISVGSHPSGFVVSPIPLDENIGLFYTSESKYPVSQVNMKELDSCNYVKLDILGLDNIEIINETCKLAGIERLTPDNVDANDEKVWQSIRESTLGVFQWESDSAFAYYKELFKPETIRKIKEVNKNFSYIELFSLGNAAIRPSGDSYRYDLANGIFKDNGHPALNEFLKSSMGYLNYQEEIMMFLVEFCGFTMAQSDSVRRGLAKKEGTQQFLPAIREGFIKTMTEKYGETVEHAEQILTSFLKVIEDASSYGFSVNHSTPYSYIGYINAYLRYYYPLEFLTVLLNINQDDTDKTAKITEYAKTRGIEIKPIKFRKSNAKYNLSKEENAIYKGLASIKHLNEKIAGELYELGKNTYDSFVNLLVDIEEKTSVNSRQMDILLRLNFFEEFGVPGKLLNIYNEFSNGKNRFNKTHKPETKAKRIAALKEYEQNAEEIKIPLSEQIQFEKQHLGYAQLKMPNIDESYVVITEIDKTYSPKLTCYHLKSGEEKVYKMNKKTFYDSQGKQLFQNGMILKLKNIELKNKMRKGDDGNWIKLDETEEWIGSCSIIKQN
jgi:DNA polymerase-3 subunit alpha